ncbi:hypothetical protein DH2020_025538 [Rehmannia glutinosa]|uniref:DWNN domain-containing protein n=1 Tax=Rehmannia glutinosa TaxID=99300 RepID=A0ABR0VZL9_REHGL
MSIRFKFRSSVNFDTVEIGDRASITVGELRAKILRGKTSQQQQQGFDLVFSDAVSGLEYKSDDYQIPSGSSVIVRRVPGGTLPSAVPPIQAVKDVGMKESHNLIPTNGQVDEFDDLGADCCPMPDSYFPDFNLESDRNNFMGTEEDQVAGSRLECQKNGSSDLNQAIPRGIRQVLIEKGMCPKCYSSKCSVEDLLPNLSLRQAIEHFCEAQMLDAGLGNAMQKYVPDGESGIQAKDFSCAFSVVQKELELPQSSCATGKGSNQVEQHRRNVPYGTSGNRDIKAAHASHKVNQIDVIRGRYPRHIDMPRGPEDFAPSADFQGENQPVMPPANVHDEGNGAFHGGMPGYAPPYWNGSSMPPFRPYANMYNNPAMMPFNASMGKISDEEDDSPECYRHTSPEKPHDYRLQKEMKPSLSRSDDSLARRSGRKSQHDKFIHSDVRNFDERHEKSTRLSHAGRDKRSNSGKEEVSRSSDRHNEERHKHHHGESKMYHERKGHYDSDSSFGHHSTQKDAKRRVESDVRGSHKKDHSFPEGHDSRHSRHTGKHLREKQHDDRWQVVDGGFDEGRRDEYRYHKRRAH